tara:strand:+ start:49 stop:177 length:129 start_codon:yes stop_codon:yes gene_type:complete
MRYILKLIKDYLEEAVNRSEYLNPEDLLEEINEWEEEYEKDL